LQVVNGLASVPVFIVDKLTRSKPPPPGEPLKPQSTPKQFLTAGAGGKLLAQNPCTVFCIIGATSNVVEHHVDKLMFQSAMSDKTFKITGKVIIECRRLRL
jgi:hypothetical protein